MNIKGFSSVGLLLNQRYVSKNKTETFFFSPPQTGRGSERQLWVDDKTQKCIRFHGSVSPTSARYTSALCFKRNPRLSYAWPAKPLNCWSGVSSWIKSSVPWIKGRNALNAQILSLARGTQALWLLKCTAFKWKGLFLARVLFHSALPHLGVSLIAVVFWMRPHSVYIYLRSQSPPPPLFKTWIEHSCTCKHEEDYYYF